MANPADTQTTNIVAVQGVFGPEPDFTLQYFVGPAGTPFLPPAGGLIDGATIIDSTIDNTVIGGTTPAAANFTNIETVTGQVTTLPIADNDIANKQYVDSVAQGLDIKAACAYTTTGNITLSGLTTQAGGDWGSTLTAGTRILVKNQTASAENGIYAASATGWTRTSDMNVWSEVPSAFTFIQQGTTLSDTGWVCTADPGGTINVTAMPWTQFSGAGTYLAGNGLQIVGNTFSVKPNGTSLDASSSGLKISDTYAGQTSITTLGTIGTGVWHGSTIGVAYGGTGAATFSAGYVKADGTTAFTTVATIPNTDITGLGTMSTQNANNVAITGGSAALGTLKTINLTGYLYGNDNTGNVTASTTIPNTAITGLGTMSTQNANAVAITGGTATGLTNLGADYLQLNTAAAASYAYGKLYWSSTGTLNVGLDGSSSLVMPVGEVLYTYGKASSAISVGQVVIKTGVVGASGVIQFGPSTAGLLDGNTIVGIACEPIASGSFGRIVNHGVVRGFNLSAFNNNDTLWYDPAGGGALTATKPSAPNLKAEVGIVINNGPGGSGSMFVSLFPGSQLGGTDQNVQITGTPSNGSLLQYNSSLQYWENVASSTVSVGTATNLAGGGAGYIPYQSGSGATYFLSAGTTGQVLTSNGSSAPTWSTPTAYATVTDDTTSAGTRYPLFANQTTGNLTTEYTSSTKLQYVPSTGILTATGFSGSGSGLTSLPAGQLSGTIPSGVLGNSTLYIGTTAIALNRASASQTLTGTNIDGSAGSASTATTATNATNIAITDNTSSASTWYPVFSANSTGNNPATTSSTKLQYVPSTGVLTSTSFSGAGTGLTGTASSLSIGGNAATVTNGVYTTGSYADPTWITSLAGSKISGNISGNAANVTGTVAVANGGTGLTSTPSNGQIDIGNGTGFTRTTLTAGSNVTITNGAGSITIASTGGAGLTWQSVQTSNFTAVAGNAYPVNTTSASVTVTLPASPTAGQFVTILDYAGIAATNSIVINPNGSKIQGSTTNFSIAINRQACNFVYVDATQGWLSYAQQYAAVTNNTYSASYLIVAGGGAGGGGVNLTSNGGGGGAGGYLSGTTTLTSGTTYSFVVGSGGAGASQASGSAGNNSSGFSLTAIGGGYGGGGSGATAGGNGGSGGGGNILGSGGAGAAGSGTSGQGNAGGTGLAPAPYPAGSGGGASAVGGSAGNAGGNGTASSITGSSVTYAGGGGGGTNNTTSIAGGAGGGGAGGNGTISGTLNGTAATANTGGGGGGGATNGIGNSSGGNGGSGVVIISVLTANYTGITTGSPTVTTSGSNTILKFTSSGSYTA